MRVEIHGPELKLRFPNHGWTLNFQRCEWPTDDGAVHHGFRFIWRRPDGSLQAARGQARIPSLPILKLFLDAAIAKGWDVYQDTTWSSLEVNPLHWGDIPMTDTDGNLLDMTFDEEGRLTGGVPKV